MTFTLHCYATSTAVRRWSRSPTYLLFCIFLKNFWIIGDKLAPSTSFILKNLFQRLIIGRFMSKSCRNRPSTPYDSHHSHGLFDNVDFYRKLPISSFGRWQRSQSLPLHHEENYYPPDPQRRPSTSQAVVPYSTTPMSLSSLACSSTTATRAEDDYNRDPPGLSNEISDVVGVTSVEFERYERNFTSYVLTAVHRL